MCGGKVLIVLKLYKQVTDNTQICYDYNNNNNNLSSSQPLEEPAQIDDPLSTNVEHPQAVGNRAGQVVS